MQVLCSPQSRGVCLQAHNDKRWLIMKLPGSRQSRGDCLQAHNDKRPEPCESLTVVQHAADDRVTVWNSQLNVCQLDILYHVNCLKCAKCSAVVHLVCTFSS